MVNIKDQTGVGEARDLIADWTHHLQIGTQTDKLDAIFAIQERLEQEYKEIEERNLGMKLTDYPVDIDSCYDQQQLKDCMWRIVEELGEAGNCLKNKPWKKDHKETDREHLLEEIADAFHFFIKLCLMLGLTSESLFEHYLLKAGVNRFRQRSNY